MDDTCFYLNLYEISFRNGSCKKNSNLHLTVFGFSFRNVLVIKLCCGRLAEAFVSPNAASVKLHINAGLFVIIVYNDVVFLRL